MVIARNFAGVFDGHGGESAADYLQKNFYDAFSSLVSEEAYAEECSVEGISPIRTILEYRSCSCEGLFLICNSCAHGLSNPYNALLGPANWDQLQIPSAFRVYCYAEREAGGLCCPVELSGLLKAAFAKMDEQLLQWLKGNLLNMTCTQITRQSGTAGNFAKPFALLFRSRLISRCDCLRGMS